MASKEVTVKVGTDVDDSKVKALEDEIERLKLQRLQLKIDANKESLSETEARIQQLKTFLSQDLPLGCKLDDSEIQKAAAELEQLESQKLNLQLSVADDELTKAKAEEEALNDTAHVDIDVDDSAVQGALQNINDGINQTKQGLGELKEGFAEVQQAGMQSEQN